ETVPDRGRPAEHEVGRGRGQAEVRDCPHQEEDASADHRARDVPGRRQQAEPRPSEDHQEAGPPNAGVAISLRRGDPTAATGHRPAGSCPEARPNFADGTGRDEIYRGTSEPLVTLLNFLVTVSIYLY
ncbi:hypothetical protein AVEN_249096-1, partial [Araneus ventricosus]